jgi:hypothetical protein
VTVRVTNGTTDALAVYDAANTTKLNLGDLALKADRTSFAGAVFTATMLMSGNNVVITLGALSTGSTKSGLTTTTAMVWTPSTAATDLAGNAVSSAAATESGALDVDF